MGNKTNPIGMRVQVNRTWDSRWYADTKEYGDLLLEDIRIREFIRKDAKQAGIARVIIERPHRKCRVTIHAARPGVIIGKKGADIEALRKKLSAMTDSELHLNIVEVRKPELDATLVGESIAQQLERRVSFRRAMKRAVQNAMRMGALGIRVNVAGRLGGAEIARRNGTARAACRCTRCGRTSITPASRPKRPTASSGSRSGSSRARSWSTTRARGIGACRRSRTVRPPAAPAAAEET